MILVTWEIEVDADTPDQAALAAWAAQRRPDTTASVFTVAWTGGNVRVDVADLAETGRCPKHGLQPVTHRGGAVASPLVRLDCGRVLSVDEVT